MKMSQFDICVWISSVACQLARMRERRHLKMYREQLLNSNFHTFSIKPDVGH